MDATQFQNAAQGMPQNGPIFQSSTEAFLGDSETPIPVRVGHLDEGVPTLSREEFKRASLRQRQLDAEAEAPSKNPQPPTMPTPAQPLPLKLVGVRPSGKPSRARRTTSPPVFDGTIIPQVDQIDKKNAEFEARIAKMEAGQAQLARGVDKLVELLAARDAAAETRLAEVQPGTPRYHPPTETREEESKEVGDAAPLVTEEQAHVFDAMESDDDDVDLGDPETWDSGDPNIARMQAFIQRRTPLKDFRRFWQSLCPRAGFQEWPQKTQERFMELFGTIILHPKFLTQVRRTVLTFRNGQCMGEEQEYKMLVMLAGNCAIYSIITAEV